MRVGGSLRSACSANYNPMATTDRPRWLNVYAYLGNILSSRRIEPGANLVEVIEAEAATGWRMGGPWNQMRQRGEWGNFFTNRGGVRRMVAIVEVSAKSTQHSMNGPLLRGCGAALRR